MKKSLKKKKEETDIQQIVNHYFYTKGLSLDQIKKDARKKKIIYSRFTRPAKQLLILAGSIKKAMAAIDKVAQWANSRKLDYAIEEVAGIGQIKAEGGGEKALFSGRSFGLVRIKEKMVRDQPRRRLAGICRQRGGS